MASHNDIKTKGNFTGAYESYHDGNWLLIYEYSGISFGTPPSFPDYWSEKTIAEVIKKAYDFFEKNKDNYKLIYQNQDKE
jgi:hypothetical protein